MSRIHQFLFFSFCSFNLAAHPAEVIWEKQYGIGIPDSSIVVADVIEGGNDELVLTTTTGRVIAASRCFSSAMDRAFSKSIWLGCPGTRLPNALPR